MPLLATARTITAEPGELAASAPGSLSEAQLVITGTINAADLDRLTGDLPAGSSLDLSAVNIAAYDGGIVGVACSRAPADALPPYILAGLRSETLVLPASLKTIGEGALLDAAITSVEIPAGVVEIGDAAFAGCRSLSTVTFADGSAVDAIPTRCFDGDAQLTTVSLPDGLGSIGSRAFAGCNSLTSLEFPATLVAIADEAFAASGLQSLDLARCHSLRRIGTRAWAECTALATATLPAGAMLGGEAIFMGCPLLTAVSLPAKATSIPALTLAGASSLPSLYLPEGVDSIGVLALAHASAVRTLALPASLRHIDSGAFEECTGLEHIDASALENVPTLGDEVWSGVICGDVTLRATADTEQAFLDALQWQDFSIVTSGITSIPAADNPGDDVAAEVCGSFNSAILTISSDIPVTQVTVYSLDGAALEIKPSTPQLILSADTSALGGRVMIVTVALRGHLKPVSLKLLRR